MKTLAHRKTQALKNQVDFEESIAKITRWQALIEREEQKISDYFDQNPEALLDE